MRARQWVCTVAALLACVGAYAEEDAAVVVRTRPDVMRVSAPFNIIVQTTGTPLGSISLPKVDNIRIDPEPVATGNTFIYRDGGMLVSTEKRFVAVADAPGTYTIPPVHAEIADEVVTSNEVTIEVLAQNAPASEEQQAARDRAIPVEEAFFIRTELDKTEVYQGEAILMALSLWRVNGVEARTGRGSAVRPPDTTGFYTVDLPPSREVRQRLVDGVNTTYEVHQTRRLLFPTAAGDLTIGGWNIEGEIHIPDPQSTSLLRGRRHRMPLTADPVEVGVKPLPASPAGFSGAVGQFQLNTRLSKQSTYLGQPVQLVAEITGSGNPDAIGAPRLSAIPGVHASSPRAHTDLDKNEHGILVRKQFEFTLTPNQMGDVTIPAMSFVYFDPVNEEYVTLEGREYPLMVGRPQGGTARTFIAAEDAAGAGFSLTAEELAPPADAPAELSRQPGVRTGILAAGYVFPVLGYAGLAAFLLRRRRFERDTALARAHSARHRMDQRLHGIGQSPEPANELYRALCGYAADHLNAPEAGMTPEELAALCAERGLPPEAYAGILKTLRACERVRYAGGQLRTSEVHALLEAAEVHIAQFDAAMKEVRAA